MINRYDQPLNYDYKLFQVEKKTSPIHWSKLRLSIKSNNSVNPILRGGGHICPPYHISAIFSGRTHPRRLQVNSNFKFFNYGTHEIGPRSKSFPTARGSPPKLVG